MLSGWIMSNDSEFGGGANIKLIYTYSCSPNRNAKISIMLQDVSLHIYIGQCGSITINVSMTL